MQRLFILICYLITSVAVTASETSLKQTLSAHLSEAAVKALARPGVTGITMAAGKKGEIIFTAGYGVANTDTGAPVTPQTKMRAGSVSKVFTTALIGKLLESGQLDLDAPIQQYVPSFPTKRWPVSLRQMAAHMGGIRHYRGNEFSNTKHYPTVLAGLDFFKNDPLMFEPGTRSEYSSYAWNLISAALEKAGGEPFLNLMQTEVFHPLGMTNTVAEDITQNIEHIAAFHETRNGKVNIAPFVDNSYKWAGGGFVGTATDMAKLGLAHTKASFLSADTLNLLGTEQKTSVGDLTGFGIGWMTARAMQRRLERNNKTEYLQNFSKKLIWHSGGSMGAVALLLVDPAEGSAVALMANNSSSFPTILDLGLEALGLLQTN